MKTLIYNLFWAVAGLAYLGCAGADTGSSPSDFGCTYPDGPDVMAFEEPLPAYGWPEAYDTSGDAFPLSMGEVYCRTDANRDWSAIDYVYFISIPAW